MSKVNYELLPHLLELDFYQNCPLVLLILQNSINENTLFIAGIVKAKKYTNMGATRSEDLIKYIVQKEIKEVLLLDKRMAPAAIIKSISQSFFNDSPEKFRFSNKKYLIPENNYAKYNANICCRVNFSESGLENLKRKYHHVRGLPGFLHHLMRGRRTKESLFKPELFIWTPDKSAITLPGASFNFFSQNTQNHVHSLKNDPGGFGLVTWTIHPTLLTKYGWQNNSGYQDHHVKSFKKFLDEHRNNDLPRGPNFFARRNSQEIILHIETQAGLPYLATLLDLTVHHLPYLYSLKETNLIHLSKVYGVVPNKDLVEMYFHFPYPEHNTTLHLHVRVNQGTHPTERARSFSLHEVISCLEKGDNPLNLVLSKGPIYCEDMEFLHDVPGVTLEGIKNPFPLSTPYVENEISPGNFKI